MAAPLLEVRNLVTEFKSGGQWVRAVNSVSFTIHEGETFGLVGESGCGKSVTSLSIMRLVPNPPGRISSGEIRFQGRDLLKLSEAEMRKVRGNQISMIFQEPMTSLNPVFTVGEQIAEAVRLHRGMNRRDAEQEAVRLLDLVAIPAPEVRVKDYPHQLSGGMRQRVMIAIALSCNPKVLIADEPTTALDVTVQAQILELLAQLQHEFKIGLLLITHDLGVVAEVSNRVAIMYAGKIVEECETVGIFADPAHPYTQGLLNSIPRPGYDRRTQRLEAIPGMVPRLADLPAGCSFQPRCAKAVPQCSGTRPALLQLPSAGHTVRCHLHEPAPHIEESA